MEPYMYPETGGPRRTPLAESDARGVWPQSAQERREADLVPQSMWYYKEIDVSRLFPLSRLYALRKSGLWLCLAAAAALAWFLLQRFAAAQSLLAAPNIGLYAAAAALLPLLLSLTYHELYRLTYSAKIDGFRLVISRGVFFRERGSLPILPLSEIYIRRSFFDILLGLANVQVLTALDKTERFAAVEGLPAAHAEALQQFLSDQLSRQVFLADIPHVNKETGEETSYRRFYTQGERPRHAGQ